MQRWADRHSHQASALVVAITLAAVVVGMIALAKTCSG